MRSIHYSFLTAIKDCDGPLCVSISFSCKGLPRRGHPLQIPTFVTVAVGGGGGGSSSWVVLCRFRPIVGDALESLAIGVVGRGPRASSRMPKSCSDWLFVWLGIVRSGCRSPHKVSGRLPESLHNQHEITRVVERGRRFWRRLHDDSLEVFAVGKNLASEHARQFGVLCQKSASDLYFARVVKDILRPILIYALTFNTTTWGLLGRSIRGVFWCA